MDLPLTGARRPAGVVAVLVALLLVSGLLLAVLPEGASRAAGAREVPTPGAAGIGDPYFPLDGNGGIDVRRYEVHDAYDFASRRLSGWTRLTVRATQSLSRFDLDLLLPVTSVTVDRRVARFAKPDKHELRIVPRAPIASGTVFQVVVRYAGRPGAVGYLGERNWLADDGEVLAMNEPHMAPWWFPANDHPRDKAVMDIRITTAADKQVIANGRRVSRHVSGRQATTRWQAAEPMAPYLAFFTAGSFVVDHGVHRGLPWLVAVSRKLPASQQTASLRLMRRTPQVVDWLQSQLGRYPFGQTGGLTTGLDPGFALENQTRPTYPALGPGAVGLLVHELSHQWFGDSVSIARWRDIWLNEGAATFMQARYTETHGGETAQQWMRSWYDSFGAGDEFWTVPVANPGRARIFDWAVYQRGGMTLQALHNRIGNADFWRLLRRWTSDRRGGNGTTEQFQALAEQVSGQDLGGFFDAWLRERSRPADTAANGLR